MNANGWVGQISSPLAVVVGIFICFCGYRLLKLTLGILGFMAAASGGWALGLSWAPNNTGVALVCAILAGLIGAAFCIWFFFLGVFLLGASAGTIVAAAFFNASGTQTQTILLVIFAVVFGVLALVMQKFMIIASTAFSGSYLAIAGVLQLLTHVPDGSPLWLGNSQAHSAGLLSYIVLAFWIVLGLAGVSFQYKDSERREKAVRHEERPASSGLPENKET